jgi:hypothetical protein
VFPRNRYRSSYDVVNTHWNNGIHSTIALIWDPIYLSCISPDFLIKSIILSKKLFNQMALLYALSINQTYYFRKESEQGWA